MDKFLYDRDLHPERMKQQANQNFNVGGGINQKIVDGPFPKHKTIYIH